MGRSFRGERVFGVLLLTRDERCLSRWKEALEADGARVWENADPRQLASTAVEVVDVVVADRPLDERPGEGAVLDATLLLVGAAGAADWTLPADHTPRELRIACGLLAQLARARRAQRQLDEASRQLRRLAETDPLTGVANRRAWDAFLAAGLERAGAAGRPLTLVLLDVDRLKQVNDQLGYGQGDDLLRLTAAALEANIRGGDLVARLGGDEFSLLLADLPAASVHDVVERIRLAVCRRLSERFPEVAPRLTAAAVPVTAAVEPGRLMAAADRALRAAKAAGRDRTALGRL